VIDMGDNTEISNIFHYDSIQAKSWYRHVWQINRPGLSTGPEFFKEQHRSKRELTRCVFPDTYFRTVNRCFAR
jgi:hypothetical protein